MKSTEKVLAFVEHANELPDSELEAAIPLPLPAGAVRMVLATFVSELPRDPAELDGWLDQLADFAHAMRTDDEPATV